MSGRPPSPTALPTSAAASSTAAAANPSVPTTTSFSAAAVFSAAPDDGDKLAALLQGLSLSETADATAAAAAAATDAPAATAAAEIEAVPENTDAQPEVPERARPAHLLASVAFGLQFDWDDPTACADEENSKTNTNADNNSNSSDAAVIPVLPPLSASFSPAVAVDAATGRPRTALFYDPRCLLHQGPSSRIINTPHDKPKTHI